MTKISFVNHVYLEVLTSFSVKHQKTLTNMYIKNGMHRFRAAFVDTYKLICLKEDGDISDEKIQNRFIYKLREKLKEYTIESVIDRIASLTVYAANKFGGQYTNEINDLLQEYHVELVRKGYSKRKILSDFKKIEDKISITDSYDEWHSMMAT